jgi:hypothetical protein
MAFINYNPAFLLILNVDGSQERKVSLHTWNALDVAYIDQNTAAVASDFHTFIDLVDLNTGKTVKTMRSCDPSTFSISRNAGL